MITLNSSSESALNLLKQLGVNTENLVSAKILFEPDEVVVIDCIYYVVVGCKKLMDRKKFEVHEIPLEECEVAQQEITNMHIENGLDQEGWVNCKDLKEIKPPKDRGNYYWDFPEIG